MITEIAESIIQKYNSNGVLKSALSGGLYFQQAPQFAAMPYGVFYYMGSTDTEIMGSATNEIVEIELQFNLFSDTRDGGMDIASLTDLFGNCFDWTILNISGYECLKMARESILAIDLVDEVWQASLGYELWIEKE